jgi:hypothetical protein
VGGIGNQDYPANSESGRASLLKLIWAETDEFVIARFWVAREYPLKTHRLPFYNLLAGQARVVAVCDTP